MSLDGWPLLKDKYDTEKRWFQPCLICEKPVEMCAATSEVKGPYHDGCFGWPMCSCKKEHQGDCVPEAMGVGE